MSLLAVALLIVANTGIDIYFQARENQRANVPVDLTISTIGDSLTDSGHNGDVVQYSTMEFGSVLENCYQYYTYKYLKTRQLETRVQNFGISGQTVSQICGRFNTTVPADYIVCMAGTNDVWRANYSTPGINAILATRVIDIYNATIFGTIAYQQSRGHAAPVIILCSIPPFGNVSPPTLYVPGAIRHVNAALKAYVQGLNRSNILFCDVYATMSNAAGWMIDGLYWPDGVHFNPTGDQVAGEAIAQVISNHNYHPVL